MHVRTKVLYVMVALSLVSCAHEPADTKNHEEDHTYQPGITPPDESSHEKSTPELSECALKPMAEWAKLLNDWPVVVIASKGQDGGVLCGNGVLIGRYYEHCEVVTCAHLIADADSVQRMLRVGILGCVAGNVMYREVEPQIICVDTTKDLALLKVAQDDSLRSILSTMAVGTLDNADEDKSGIIVIKSLSPFGRPYTAKGRHPRVYQGQSGSPQILSDNHVVGILSRVDRTAGLDEWIAASDIKAFVDRCHTQSQQQGKVHDESPR